MQLYIKLKQAGKRRLLIEKQAIEIEDIGTSPTLKTLISAVVSQQVAVYNDKTPENSIINFLTDLS
jgi:hypothetical protein